MATLDLFPNLGKFTVTQFVTPTLRLTPEAARELALAQRILTAVGTAVAAVDVGVTPAGGISSVNVQAALVELDTEKADAAGLATSLAGKQPADATLTALAGMATAADKLSYWSGVDVAALTDFTPLARTLLAGTTAALMRGTLGLGTLATQTGTFSGTSSGTNTGDQTITLTGDVTGSGAGSFAATVAPNAITYAKMQDVSAASVLLGRGAGAGAGDPQEITLGTGLTMTGTTLSAAGGGSGTVTSVSVTTANGFAGTVATPTTTPAITLTTSVTGLLKGNGTAISAAAAGTDYVAPGGALGTPSSGTLTNASGLPIATGVSGLAAGVAAFLATPSSANMAAMVTDETGTGANVFATAPDLTNAKVAGNIYFQQSTPPSKSAAALLTGAEVMTGLIQYTGSAASLTLPTGSTLDASVVVGLLGDRAFEFSVVNTGSGAVTLIANTGLTLVGSMVVANGASGQFRMRKTGAALYTLYRTA